MVLCMSQLGADDLQRGASDIGVAVGDGQQQFAAKCTTDAPVQKRLFLSTHLHILWCVGPVVQPPVVRPLQLSGCACGFEQGGCYQYL